MSVYLQATKRAISKSVMLLDSITDNSKFEIVREELGDELIALVHFVGDIYARMSSSNVWQDMLGDDKGLIFAFAYLNNQIKHDLNLEFISYEVNEARFPMSFPFRFGQPGACWSNFKDHGQSRKAKREYYEIFLMHKDIRCTLLNLAEVLDRYN